MTNEATSQGDQLDAHKQEYKEYLFGVLRDVSMQLSTGRNDVRTAAITVMNYTLPPEEHDQRNRAVKYQEELDPERARKIQQEIIHLIHQPEVLERLNKKSVDPDDLEEAFKTAVERITASYKKNG